MSAPTTTPTPSATAVRPRKEARRRSPSSTRLWGWLLLPPVLWMVAFFISSIVIVVALSFGTTTPNGQARFGTTLVNYQTLWNPTYLAVFLRSILYALATVVLCLLIGYPVAYTIALHGGRFKNALIAALVIPFFASYLVRMYAWSTLLSDDGLLNRVLRGLGISSGVQILNTSGAVIAGLTYGFVVFMVLPIYAALERMDLSLIEAGKDLYHGPFRTFLHVTVPATKVGMLGGVLLVFLPASGDFVSAQLLGGPNTYMIGNLVQQQFLEGQNWPLGSALTVFLMVALLVFMVFYLRATSTRTGEA